jgi:superfamily II DNA/RNA helicase
MSLVDLQDWLISDGVGVEVERLSWLTVVTEIDNLVRGSEFYAGQETIDWERLLLAGSILARSVERRHQEAALRIATAAVTLETTRRIRDGGAILLGQLSNHRAISLAEGRNRVAAQLDSRLGLSMRLEAQRRKIESAVLIESTGHWLSVNDFQRTFWTEATGNHNWLSVSAPTASGKTFVVLQWLLDSMIVGDARIAIYLAPTRALVSEIEDNLRALLKGTDSIDVTSLPLREKYEVAIAGGRKLILVFTQERLHLLVNILTDNVHVDLLIVDEAHKIGDHQRGVVLQDAVERVSRANLGMKVVFISPATQNPGDLLDDAPKGSNTASVDSDAPTVLQNVVIAQQVPRKPKEWTLSLRNGPSANAIGTLHLANKPAGLRKRLAFIAAAAGARGGTLIYTNGAAEAEEVALLVSQLISPAEIIDPELAELAELARKGVHRSYLLAPLVERGVAFHYGNMPSLIRMEVERLFRDGKIRFLACTSTLIEGVNLACRTIVLGGPRKGKGKPMEPHDFWNLAGRAGRWGNEFQGNIICIDPDDAKAWPGGVPERARYPIKRETDAVLGQVGEMAAYLQLRKGAVVQDLEDSDQFEQVSAYLLSTYLRAGSIAGAGFAKRHDPAEIDKINVSLAKLAEGIDLSAETAVRHSGVSAVGLQSLLNGFRSYEGDIENLLPAPAESIDSYDRFLTIMRRINTDVFPAFQPDGLVPLHALIVLEWLKGLSLAAIIKKRIDYQDARGKTYKLSVLIRDTMEIV